MATGGAVVVATPMQARHRGDVSRLHRNLYNVEYDFATLEHRLRELAS